MSDLEGMCRAGASTSAGFLAMQSAQNLVLPTNANWCAPAPARAPALPRPHPAHASRTPTLARHARRCRRVPGLTPLSWKSERLATGWTLPPRARRSLQQELCREGSIRFRTCNC